MSSVPAGINPSRINSSGIAPAGINPTNVERWLSNAGLSGPFSFDQIAGGKSNLTYRVTTADGGRYVLRRPPLGNVLATAHDVAREHKIISALAGSAVPVAPVVGLCTDLAVNDAPFYVMGFVDGVVLDSPEAGAKVGELVRAAASTNLIDTMVALHSIDVDEVGLGDLGKRTGYLDRQLRRWKTQWDNSKTRDLQLMDTVHARLVELQPEQHSVGIVHGDYRLGNCMINPTTGALNAVLDWELCTLGDVLADIGYLLVYWSDPTGPQLVDNDPSGQAGFPAREEMVRRYATATGRDVADIRYFEAFSCWRLAAIAEGVLARYAAGVMGDSTGFDLAASQLRVDALAARAAALL
jgi:aminoglycoside phosphotransferase (APT) family kinase protein